MPPRHLRGIALSCSRGNMKSSVGMGITRVLQAFSCVVYRTVWHQRHFGAGTIGLFQSLLGNGTSPGV